MATNESKPSVIVVDDEQVVVESITAFLKLEPRFSVFGFADPEQALRFAQSQRVDVAISDYRMPALDGLQLLGRIKEIQPEASRILLSSHADAHSVLKAINQVALFQYLEKPWDEEQLLLAVQSGAERSELLRELRARVGELDSAHNTIKAVQSRLIHAFL